MNFKGTLGASVASVAMATMLAVPGLAFAADNDAKAATPDEAKLTKVIEAPMGTNLSSDSYVFTFEGAGTVQANGDKLFTTTTAGNLDQDNKTLKAGDTVPTIPAVTLNGVELTEANSVEGDGFAQTAVQTTLSDVLNLGESDEVKFNHAGVYTYRVSETDVHQGTSAYLVKSEASYLLRVYVENDAATGEPTVKQVTVEKEKKDDGTTIDGEGAKKDSTYPQTTDGKITKEYDTQTEELTTPAGDENAKNVNGFTFTNEYMLGAQLIAEKQVAGNYGDTTREFPITLNITAPTAPAGAIITYEVTDGTDTTTAAKTSFTADGETLEGIVLGEGGTATLTADLVDDGKIVVTGLYGAAKADGSRDLIAAGISQGTKYTVTENVPEYYVGKGYAFDSADATVDTPSIDTTADFNAAAGETLSISGDNVRVGANGAHAFVFNIFDDEEASPTGILINNLPYLLLVGLPLVALMAWFVNRRKGMAL